MTNKTVGWRNATLKPSFWGGLRGGNLTVVSMVVAVECLIVWLSRQVSARKLKPHPPRPRSLHERLLEDIKAERKLRPVSPDMIRRSRLGEQLTVAHINIPCLFAVINALMTL